MMGVPHPKIHKMNVLSLPPRIPPLSSSSVDRAQKLRLQNEFALFVLLIGLICLIIFPPHRLFTLLAADVPDQVPAGSHVPLASWPFFDVHHAGKEVSFAVLAAEVLHDISSVVRGWEELQQEFKRSKGHVVGEVVGEEARREEQQPGKTYA